MSDQKRASTHIGTNGRTYALMRIPATPPDSGRSGRLCDRDGDGVAAVGEVVERCDDERRRARVERGLDQRCEVGGVVGRRGGAWGESSDAPVEVRRPEGVWDPAEVLAGGDPVRGRPRGRRSVAGRRCAPAPPPRCRCS